MSISEKIRQEHEEFRSILKDLSETTVGNADVRRSVFPKVMIRIDAHLRAEEATLYDGMKGNSDLRELALEGIEEHRVARQLMEELEQTAADAEMWLPKLKVLRENMEDHIQREEKDTLPRTEEVLSKDQMDRWGDEFVDIERRIRQMTVR